ncbi:MAG: xanthine dehydrogenase family protein subunit M [Gammaproteobacteria bacterium]|nr:xanthine dehydrogenase family protein subunit M [Gammaproteobacteria bacterium]
MYPAPFRYHRAGSVAEAIRMLGDIGEGARALAGGQSLLVLLKVRFDEPTDLVDLARIPDLDTIDQGNGEIRIGALTTHASIARSELSTAIPIVGDCANGIADNQVRSRGTIGGNVCSGDPSCDWPTLLATLDAQVHCEGPDGKRAVPVTEFVEDLYATVLGQGEIVTGISFPTPAVGSAGAYVGFKRCAPAYPTSSVGLQLALNGDDCEDVRIALGSSGLTSIHATDAEAELRGKTLTDDVIAKAAEAAAAQAEPIEDQRGSEDFKRSLIDTLVKRGVGVARRRCAGETVEVSHEYY